MSVMFGDYLQNRRIDRGYTLRRFCEENKLSPVDISRLENGNTCAPDSDDELAQLAGFYGILEDSMEYTELRILALQSRATPPKPLSPDLPEAHKHLPAFCRMTGKTPLTIDAAAELLKLVSGDGHG